MFLFLNECPRPPFKAQQTVVNVPAERDRSLHGARPRTLRSNVPDAGWPSPRYRLRRAAARGAARGTDAATHQSREALWL